MKNWPTKKYIKILEKMPKEQLIKSHIREAELRYYYEELYYDLCDAIMSNVVELIKRGNK